MSDEVDNLLARASAGENFTVDSNSALLMVQRLRERSDSECFELKDKLDRAEDSIRNLQGSRDRWHRLANDAYQQGRNIQKELDDEAANSLEDATAYGVEAMIWREAKSLADFAGHARSAEELSTIFETMARQADDRKDRVPN